MGLLEKIDRIIFEEDITLKIFLEKTGFSKGLYYSIKSGDKTSLKPEQAKAINKAFPNFTYEWLTSKNDIIQEPSVNYGTIESLVEKGQLGEILNKMHKEYLERDNSYAMWFEKENHVSAMKLLKGLLEKKQLES